MHEMSIVSNIMDIALKTAAENNLSSISRIKIKVGNQHHLADDLMVYAFSFMKKGTIAASAVLEIERVEITAECRHCGYVFTVKENMYLCPECSSVNPELLRGRELIIESIEGDI